MRVRIGRPAGPARPDQPAPPVSPGPRWARPGPAARVGPAGESGGAVTSKVVRLPATSLRSDDAYTRHRPGRRALLGRPADLRPGAQPGLLRPGVRLER